MFHLARLQARTVCGETAQPSTITRCSHVCYLWQLASDMQLVRWFGTGARAYVTRVSHPGMSEQFGRRGGPASSNGTTDSEGALSNSNPATVLRPSGMVVSTHVVKDYIRPDMRDPFTDPPAPLKEKDIIALRVEGTGYAAKTEERSLKVQKTDASSAVGGGGGW